MNKIDISQIGYIFSFEGTDYKLTLFANCFLQAKQYLAAHPTLCHEKVTDVSCFRPIKNLTLKKVMNGTFVWVGDESPDGWRRIE
jgi:hypothetical protein